MADPISIGTLAAISIGTAAAGAGVGAVGSIMGGNANAQMYQYQAGVAQLNKKIAEQNASYARQAGEVTAQESGLKTAAEIGTTRAHMGASGISVNSDSSQRVLSSESEIGQQNQAIIRSNAARQAYGYEIEGVQQQAQSDLDRMAASKSKTAGTLGAISSIIGGASSVSSKWMQAKSVGLVPAVG